MSVATICLNRPTDGLVDRISGGAPASEAGLPGFAVPDDIPAFLQVDLGAIAANWHRIDSLTGSDTIAAAVVKADAYGLGMAPVAGCLMSAGCRWFFAMTAAEGFELADILSGNALPVRIAVLAGPTETTVGAFLRSPLLVPVLNDLDQIAMWRRVAPGRPSLLHLDSGMSRFGLRADDIVRLTKEPRLLEGLRPVVVMSHLACSDEPDNPMNGRQRSNFLAAAAGLVGAGLPEAPLSLAASSGIFLGPPFRFGMVRPGAALYGINPSPGLPNPMRPVVHLRARILQVADIDPGDAVGYGATWISSDARRIATLAIGYADGIPRAAGNRASAFIAGRAAPFVGRVSMDLVTVDVSAIPSEQIRVGDFAELFGPHQSIDDFARDCGTLGYEILTRLGPRVHRIYREASNGAA